MSGYDRVFVEVLNNYTQATVREMSAVLKRTAYTTYVKETDDFFTGLAAPDGEFFCYPRDTGIVGHVGLRLDRVLQYAAPIDEGDVVIFNDPYVTAGMSTHLPDIHVIKPIFSGDRLLCFAYAFIHSSDVGGSVPASISPLSNEIFQEGVRIPPVKLYVKGVLQEAVRELILLNCRIPEENWGDIRAMVAALNSSERSIGRIVHKFGVDAFVGGIEALMDYAEERARGVIARIPDGEYSFTDFLEDDVASPVPIRLAVRMSVEGDQVHLDFAGTDHQVLSAFNVPTGNRDCHPFLSAALVSHILTQEPHVPLNGGLLRPIRMSIPEGTVLNPRFPAACGVRWATVVRMFDVILGALHQAIPDEVPCAGAGQACIIVAASTDPISGKQRVNVIEPVQGGSGAMKSKDGIHGTYYSASLRNTPIESVENHSNVLVKNYSLVPDTGGAGRFRGGCALRLDFEAREPMAITARGMERYRFAPWGVSGGRAGENAVARLHPGTPAEEVIDKIAVLHMMPGETLSIQSAGGGGYGPPMSRDPAMVLADVREGWVSVERAEGQYGVVVRGGEIDWTETAARRATDVVGTEYFDFGVERSAYDEVWDEQLLMRYFELISAHPPTSRSRIRTALHSRLFVGRSDGHSPGDRLRILEEIMAGASAEQAS